MTVSTSFEVSRYACRTLPRDIFCWSNMDESIAQTPSSDNMKTGGADFVRAWNKNAELQKKTSGRGVRRSCVSTLFFVVSVW